VKNKKMEPGAARSYQFLRAVAWAALGVSALLLVWSLAGERIVAWILTQSLPNNASSVGIIGGADGPTAVFVTGITTTGSGYGWIDTAVYAAVMAAAAVTLWKTRK